MIVLLQDVKNEQKTSKAGKPYTATGIKVDGTWYNGFGNKETLKWEPGMSVEVDLFEEEYQEKMYKKFKVLQPIDILTSRMDALELALKTLTIYVKQHVKP
jgi:hypothetical protein